MSEPTRARPRRRPRCCGAGRRAVMGRDARQELAITNPLYRADNDPRALAPFTRDRKHATGLLVRTILAVDR